MWVKERFVDPAPPTTTIWDDAGRSRVFIPATMDDNPTLMYNDPNYVANIESLKESDPETYKAWRWGDWEVFAGQVFREFKRRTHVIKPLIPSRKHTHVIWIDWGYSENSAHAVYLSAIINMQTSDGQKYNQIVTYQEWYNNGIEPRELARDVYRWCTKNNISPQYAVSDPAIHSPTQEGRSGAAVLIEEEWKSLHGGNWCKIHKGKNSGTNGRINRVAMMHAWFSVNPSSQIPYWVVTESCPNFIRTVPNLTYDETVVEAYATDQEDHAADSASYGLEKVKYIAVKPGTFSTNRKPLPITSFNKKGEPIAINLDRFATIPKKKKRHF